MKVRKTQPSPRAVSTALLLAGAILLAGCAPHVVKPINAFAGASADLTAQMTQTYRTVEESTINRKVLQLALLEPGEVDPERISSVNGLFKPDQLKPRLKALASLEGYAGAIRDLSSADFATDVGGASKELYSSFDAMSEIGFPIGETALKAIVTAINGIGQLRAEAKRRKAIRTIVTEADPAVQSICELLSEDIPAFQELTKANLEVDLDESLKVYGRTASRLSLESRVGLIRTARSKHLAAQETVQAFENTAEAAKKLAAAHAKLASDLNKKAKFKDLDLAAEVGELVRLGKSLKAFHASLDTEKT